MTKQIIFGVDILQHLKKQSDQENLTLEARKDLEGLIQHLEAGNKYEDYKGTN